MKKNKLFISLLIPMSFFFSSCELKTKIEMEFVFDTNFVLKNEYVDEIEQTDYWFVHESVGSTIHFNLDHTANLHLVYNETLTKDIVCTYFLPYQDEPHSSEGYIIIDGNKSNLSFIRSYYMKFEIPQSLNPIGREGHRTLNFLLWGGK